MAIYQQCLYMYICLGLVCLSTIVTMIWMEHNGLLTEPTFNLESGHERSSIVVQDLTYSFHTAEQWRKHLQLDKTPPSNVTSFPVIVTAADTTHFYDVQGMIKSIHKVLMRKHPFAKMILYDLGLLPSERKQMELYCGCEVRNFTYQKYPHHVRDLFTYAFKPIIISTVFQEYGQLWWMDASTRVLSTDFDVLTSLEKEGVYFFTYDQRRGVVICHTVMDTFKYLNIDPMTLRHFTEIIASPMAFRNTGVVPEILRQLLLCALTEECIAPFNARLECGECPVNVTLNDVGRCHRYDQSVLNILLHTHFPEPILRPLPSSVAIERCDPVAYFAEYTKQQIVFDLLC